jgi:hypothetical protein
MVGHKRALWIALLICLGLVLSGGLSGCKVITPTPAPFSPPADGEPDGEMQHAYPAPSQAEYVVSAKGLGAASSGEGISILTSVDSPTAYRADVLAAGVSAAAAGLPFYQMQVGSPAHLENFARPEACNWMGIAGQVFDSAGKPVNSLVVVVGGTLNGRTVSNQGTTGNSPAYGPGGYEIDLGLVPENSTQTIWIYVTDPQGRVLTPQYYLNTFADCQKNLILANFQQFLPYRVILPIVDR